MSRVVAIVQARTGSSRLPRKVLEDINGQTMLGHVVTRARRAARIDDVVVATTTANGDDDIVALCDQFGWPVHRGSEADVLDRYHGAARAMDADVVVRLTSDCPLLDPTLIDDVVSTLVDSGGDLDYVSNTVEPRTFPRGLDTECFTFAALDAAWHDDHDALWREHVTPFIYRHPERFRIQPFLNATDESRHRWTVDTPEDLLFVRSLAERSGTLPLDWRDTLHIVTAAPDLAAINSHIEQRAV